MAISDDAKFIDAVRTARKNGATVTVVRPGQSINVMIDKLTPADRTAIQNALNTALFSGAPITEAATP